MDRFELAVKRSLPYICCTAQKMRCFAKEISVKTFENAASLVLAIAAQALAVGVILAL